MHTHCCNLHAHLLTTAAADVDSAQVNEAVSTFKKIIDKMESALHRAAWLVGDDYSLADVAMTPLFDRLDRLGMSPLYLKSPKLMGWIGRVHANPNYSVSVAPDGKRMPAPDEQVVAGYLASAAA